MTLPANIYNKDGSLKAAFKPLGGPKPSTKDKQAIAKDKALRARGASKTTGIRERKSPPDGDPFHRTGKVPESLSQKMDRILELLK